MNIKEFVLEREIKSRKERIEKLTGINAPTVMIERLKKVIEELECSTFKVGGDIELLERDFGLVQVRKGKGGRIYLEFDCRVCYFPNARYGRYIAKSIKTDGREFA